MTIHFRRVLLFDGKRFLDGPRDVVEREGRVAEVAERALEVEASDVREAGALFPGFVDAHVHLSFANALDVARGGVTTVLDLGEPMSYATAPHPPLRFRFAGPLLTAPGGYPLRSWGADGYGREIVDDATARDAVLELADLGAAMIKIAIEPREGPLMDVQIMRTIVDAAHARDLLVAAHALENDAVRLALDAGIDVIAHTPVGRLTTDIVRECGARELWVISTLHAFNARRARRNLYALCAAGCRIAYGTDLGNGPIKPGLDIAELQSIQNITGDAETTLECACASAGALAGSGGVIAPGAPADLVWVPTYKRLADLGRAKDVWIAGERVI